MGGANGSVLILASDRGYESVVRLLESGPDINLAGEIFGGVLGSASELAGGHSSIVRLLVENVADVNFATGDYGNSLASAAARARVCVR